MITIVDYGIGNLASIANMLKRVGTSCTFARTPEEILSATSLILPGVGAFDRGMENLEERGFIEPLKRKVIEERTPVLGLCLGMQLMVETSEEGRCDGLGWFKGRCVRFTPSAESRIKVPHMGWNRLSIKRENPLVDDLGPEPRFYFVHSYHLADVDAEDTVATVTHGVEFPAVIAHGNVMGVQFHPEKSHRFGVRLMRNFARAAGAVAA